MRWITKKRLKSTAKAYLFLAPFLVLFIGMVVYPIGLGVKLSYVRSAWS